MHKALKIIALMVLVGYMSAGLIKLPKQICKPAKKIGYLIANGVTKCAAKYGISARRLQAIKKTAPAKPTSKKTTSKKTTSGKRKGKRGGKRSVKRGGKRSGKRSGRRSWRRKGRKGGKRGGKAKLKVKVKITKKAKKSLAKKIVKKMLDFIGCSRRRLSIDWIKQEARYLEKKNVAKNSQWAKWRKWFKSWRAKNKKAKKSLKKGEAKVAKKLRELVESKDVKRRMQIVAEVENHLRNLSSEITSSLADTQINRRLVVQDSSIRRAFEAIAHHVRENANARRLGFFDWVKKGWNTIKKHVSKAFKHVKKFVKKHIGPAIKWVKKGIKSIGKKAMKWACGALKNICPKACSSVVKTVAPLIKGLGIPSKCDASAISICRKSCSILCDKI